MRTSVLLLALGTAALAIPLAPRVLVGVSADPPKIKAVNRAVQLAKDDKPASASAHADSRPPSLPIGIASDFERSLQVQGWLHNDLDPVLEALSNAVASGKLAAARDSRNDLVHLREQLAEAQAHVDVVTAKAVKDALARIDVVLRDTRDLEAATSDNTDVIARISKTAKLLKTLEDAVHQCACGGSSPGNDKVKSTLAAIVDLRAELRSRLAASSGSTQASATATVNQLDGLVNVAQRLFTDLPLALARFRGAVQTEGKADVGRATDMLAQLQDMRAALSAGTQMGGQFGQKSKDAVIAIDGALIASGRPLVEASLARLRTACDDNKTTDVGAAKTTIASLRTGLGNGGDPARDALSELDDGIKSVANDYLIHRAAASLRDGGDLSATVNVLTQLQDVCAPLKDEGLRARVAAAMSSCRALQG